MVRATGEFQVATRSLPARHGVKGSARLPARLPAVTRRRRALAGSPTCAAAADIGAFATAPPGHDGALEAAAAGARRGKDTAAPLVRLGALVSAAAGALVPLLQVSEPLEP